jgi:hypothetical protein
MASSTWSASPVHGKPFRVHDRHHTFFEVAWGPAPLLLYSSRGRAIGAQAQALGVTTCRLEHTRVAPLTYRSCHRRLVFGYLLVYISPPFLGARAVGPAAATRALRIHLHLCACVPSKASLTSAPLPP